MLLGLDLGTTNVKALLAGEDGSVVAVGSEPVGLEHVGADGVEQDIEDIWRATLAAIGRLATGNDLSGVRAVGVSAQGGAMLFTDAEGRPLGPPTRDVGSLARMASIRAGGTPSTRYAGGARGSMV